ncbi:MAG: LmeA family phospholipid-binding protein [Gordonia sp. (in: high G+C Gram-positive bacteria)]
MPDPTHDSGHPDPQVTKPQRTAPEPTPTPAGPPTGPQPTGPQPTDQWETVAVTSPHPRAWSAAGPSTPQTPTPQTPTPQAHTPRPPTARLTTGLHTPGEGVEPPVDTGPAVVSSAPGRRGRGKIIALGAVGVILLLVIALVGSELWFRHSATDCLEEQFGDLTGQSTTVALSKRPVLWQKITNDFPFVQVDTDDSDSSKMSLHLRAENLHADGDAFILGSLRGSGTVAFARVIELSKQGQLGAGGSGTGTGTGTDPANPSGESGALSGTQITSITGNADGTIKIDGSVQVAIFPVPIGLTIKPVVDAGSVRFEVKQANAFIFGIPADFAQQFVDAFGSTLLADLSDEVHVDSLTVNPDGVDIAVSGQNVDLSKVGTGTQTGGGCSV